MKKYIFPLIMTVLLVITTSCKPKEEAFTPVNEHDVWEQDIISGIYEGGGVVPTQQVFNCRRDISANSQRYFRLKFNKNRVEHSVSPDGIETTVHRFAELKHQVKNIISPSEVTFTDFVLADVDVTVQRLPTETKLTVVLSPERPDEHNLYAPENSDILQAKAGDGVMEIIVLAPAEKRISLQSRYKVIGMGEDPAMECEYVELQSVSK